MKELIPPLPHFIKKGMGRFENQLHPSLPQAGSPSPIRDGGNSFGVKGIHLTPSTSRLAE